MSTVEQELPPPYEFVKLASTPALVEALKVLGITLDCTAEKMIIATDEDMAGYKLDGHFKKMYKLATDNLGGRIFCWTGYTQRKADFVSCGNVIPYMDTPPPLVYIGPKGERIKLARRPKEFVRVTCSLAGMAQSVWRTLPAINADADIRNADRQDYQMRDVQAQLEKTPVDEAQLAAGQAVLSAFEMERESAYESLQNLIAAHLAEPRFDISKAP